MDRLDVYNEDNSSPFAINHTSTEKPVLQFNNTLNSTILCHSYTLEPDFNTYFAALDPYAWVLWSCGLALLAATCVLYVVTLRSALRHWKQCAVSVAVVLAVYPLVAAVSFGAILVPRAWLLAEAASQEVVMISIYHFFSTIIAECGGSDRLIKQSAGARLETRVLPCCCWPCCVIPRPKLQKQSLTGLRWLVLQMPVVQALVYAVILILWAEDTRLYQQWFMYLLPFIAASILSGVWGIMMSVRMAVNAGINVRPRFLVLQLMLTIVKLQYGLAKALPELVDFPCVVALNPSVFANMVHNSLMMLEMLFLSIWAWRLYRVPPESLGKAILGDAVLDDATETLDVKRP